MTSVLPQSSLPPFDNGGLAIAFISIHPAPQFMEDSAYYRKRDTTVFCPKVGMLLRQATMLGTCAHV